VAAIRHLKDLGYEVVTTGNRPGELGHQYADRYVEADFSSVDAIEAVVNAVRPDVLVPSCNDFSYLTACTIAARHGFPGYDPPEVAAIVHHKDRFRDLCASLGLPSPRHVVVDVAEPQPDPSGFRFPVLVKSTDLTGGKGIVLCRKPADLAEAMAEAVRLSRRSRLVIEEIFDGELRSCSTFLRNRRVAFHYADREYLYPGSYLVQTSLGPRDPGPVVTSALIQAIETIAEALGLVDGLMHAQFLQRDDAFVIVELTRRCPGDLYGTPVDMLFGETFYTAAVLAPYLDRPLPPLPYDFARLPPGRSIARACVMVPPNVDVITEVIPSPAIRDHVRDFIPYVGFPRTVTNRSIEKFGVFFLEFDSFEYGDAVVRDFSRTVTFGP
jgi:biotin carboxylase